MYSYHDFAHDIDGDIDISCFVEIYFCVNCFLQCKLYDNYVSSETSRVTSDVRINRARISGKWHNSRILLV